MLLGIDGRGFRLQRTGMEEAAAGIYGALPGLAGAPACVAYLRGDRDALPHPAIRGVRVAPGGALGSFLWYYLGVPRQARRDGIDVFHGLFFTAPRLPCPTVVNVYDLGFITNPEWREGGWLETHFVGQARRAIRRATRVIVSSAWTAREVVAVLGVEPGRVRVVPLAASPRFHERVPEGEVAATLARHGLVRDGYLLFVGTIERRKDVPRLIGAFAGLLRRAPDLVLAIAGAEGPDGPCARARAEAIGVPGAVRFLGRVATADLPALYAGARLWATATHAEGFGIPVLEAMAAGTAVVAPAVGAIPEVAGDAARLVQAFGGEEALAEALVEVALDDGLRADLVRRGRARAGGYSWERAARETLAVLIEAAGG